MGLAVRLSSYSQGEKISGIKRVKKKTKKFPGLPLKMVLPIREICLPFSAKKEKFPFLPRSSRTEKYVFHFPQKKRNFRLWCEWDLISTRYSNETTQSKCQKKKVVNKKGRKKKTKTEIFLF